METQRGRLVRSSFDAPYAGWRVHKAVLDVEMGRWRAQAVNGDGRFVVVMVPSEQGPRAAEDAVDGIVGWELRESIPLTE